MNTLGTKTCEVTLIQAGYGSGDSIHNLPDELMT